MLFTVTMGYKLKSPFALSTATYSCVVGRIVRVVAGVMFLVHAKPLTIISLGVFHETQHTQQRHNGKQYFSLADASREKEDSVLPLFLKSPFLPENNIESS